MSLGRDARTPPAFDIPHVSRERPRQGGGDPYPASPMADWVPILRRLGVSRTDARSIEGHADQTGTTFQTELLASGVCAEEDIYRELAAELGLDFAAEVEPARLVVPGNDSVGLLSQRGRLDCALSVEDEGRTRLLVAPRHMNIPEMHGLVRRHPEFASRLAVVPRSVLRQAFVDNARPALRRMATDGLFEFLPSCSARYVVNAWQGAVLGAVAVAVSVAMLREPVVSSLVLHAVFSLFFMACVVLRLLVSGSAKPFARADLKAMDPREMPTYTVLVALYKEAPIVPDLLVALGKIVWPRSKLEIKLICEEDDLETIAAIEARKLRPWIEVIKVPAGMPRTKPKALSYALPLTEGDFVVLYDAEDKPHPLQLVEAWQRFRDDSPDLACLQAPLAIANRTASPLTGMFALEYSALFRGILPWLARNGLVLPLGGTSNHFRRGALEKAGGWDPYNVTEDADLGLRLVRLGYRVDTIRCPTHEDAPDNLGAWLPQRTRWFKGWAQTWLVHMRNPATTARDIGPGSFLMTQILFAGMVLSALTHPVMVITGLLAAVRLAVGENTPHSYSALFFIDVLNITLGYATFLILGWLTLRPAERAGFWKLVLVTPVYWGMMSVAAFRSVLQLLRRPHLWEKTPHKPHGLAAGVRTNADRSGSRSFSARRRDRSP